METTPKSRDIKTKGLDNSSVHNRRSDVARSLRQRSLGKVDTSFLQTSNDKGKSSAAPVGVSRSEDIKDQLVKQFFGSTSHNKPLDKPKEGAPKTKLVRTPSDPIGTKPKPIEAKKVWKPPQSTTKGLELMAPKFNMDPMSPSSSSNKTPKSEPKKYVSKYAHITDEKEKEAAILAQFGCKPRSPKVERKSSSSSLSSMDEKDNMENYIENDLMKNNDLYVIYGDRLRATSPKRKAKPKKDSVDCLKGILGQLRTTSNALQDDDTDSSTESSDETDTPPHGIPGSCRNIRSRFEQNPQVETVYRNRSVEKSRSVSNVGSLFEESVKEKRSQVQTSQLVPSVGRVNVPKLGPKSPLLAKRGFLPSRNQLAKSASFHKFKQSFETGNFDDSEDDYEDDVIKTTDQRNEIENELQEIRSNTRLQKMFNINKPGTTKYSALERSSSSSAVPEQFRNVGDEDTPTVSEARNSIKNIFEASSFKVTYGGGKSLTEQLKEKEKTPEPQPKKKVQFSDRNWVLETINKYFDVIDEDEEEEENDYDYEEGDEEDDEEYSEEYSEDENAMFATQVSAQRVVYPSAVPPHTISQQTRPSPSLERRNMPPSLPSNLPVASNIMQEQQRSQFAHAVPAHSTYSQVFESDYDEDEEGEEEDEEDVSEDEYEVELEVSEEEEEEEEQVRKPLSTSLLQKSASSSRIRGLFQTVLQKSPSGAGMDVSQFKANLHSHLQRRQSFSSQTNIQIQPKANSASESDDDQFEDCSEIPMETNKYYRIPL